MLAINLWVKFSSFTERSASLHNYAARTHAGAIARGPAVCLVFYQEETKSCYWRRYQQRGSCSPATHKNTCMCHLEDSAEAPGRAVRWRARCHRMKGTDKNCSASSEGLKEVTPGHSDQEAQRPVELGRKAVPLTGAVRAETRAHVGAQQWKKKCQELHTTHSGNYGHWADGIRGTEVRNELRMTRAVSQTRTFKPPKIYLWVPEFHSRLKIQNHFTIAGGNVQQHTQ